MLQQFHSTTRRVLAGILLGAGVAYSALLSATYFQTAPPGRLAPDIAEVDRLLFHAAKPISPMERRLVLSDTPLGTGPLITGRNDKTPSLSASDLAQREGERQALLDWIRSGASRTSYEQDDHALSEAVSVASITPEFVCGETSSPDCFATRHIRIRSLIQQRCLNCHDEDGDDTARLIPFDTYEAIARYLVPEAHGDRGRTWLLASLISLFPLAGAGGLAFARTSHPFSGRIATLAVTMTALATIAACWVIGSPLVSILLLATVVAAVNSMLQMLASALELLDVQRGVFSPIDATANSA